MRIFQASSLPSDYLLAIRRRDGEHTSFAERSRMFINDGYGSAHLLLPVLRGESTAFFANGNDHYGQCLWARENGLSASASEQTILLAQIEAHRTEVFYNLDPVRYGSSFVKRLPGCVRRSLCWRAAPSSGADFAAYDLVLGNFAGILKKWRDQGCNTKYFSPAWDMEKEEICKVSSRAIDVAFVGSYSSLHRRRNQILDRIAKMHPEWNIVYCLTTSKRTRIANTLQGIFSILSEFKQSPDLQRVLRPPVYGRALHSMLRNAKIVLNAHGEIAGIERGNMRCFEATGCGALLVSDRGQYPKGFDAGRNYIDYATPDEAKQKISYILKNCDERHHIAASGMHLMRTHYSKSQQWIDFKNIAE